MRNTLGQCSPTFSAPGTSFVEDSFSKDWGLGGEGRGGFKKTQAHYMYYVLYFYYYYVVLCNKIINTTHRNAESTGTLSLFS